MVATTLLVAVTVVSTLAPTTIELDEPVSTVAVVVVGLAIAAQIGFLGWAPAPMSWLPPPVALAAPLVALAGAGPLTGVTSVAVMAAGCLSALTDRRRIVAAAGISSAALVALGDLIRAVRAPADAAGAGDLELVAAAAAQGSVTVLLGIVAGLAWRARQMLDQARTAASTARAAERIARLEAAVAHERTAMARELHDIAAHHLAGITVMTAALDRQIDTDPERAKVAVREVRRQSKAMLGDLRGLVALLREPDSGVRQPVPGPVEAQTIRGIARLVADARRADTREVDLVVLEGLGPGPRSPVPPALLESVDVRGVGPLAQSAAYRTVQEALANAARHAPGSACQVTVDLTSEHEVRIGVRNDAPLAHSTDDPHEARRDRSLREPPGADDGEDSAGGFGLVGMRERAELTGAALRYGPTADGGWSVELRLPAGTSPALPSPDTPSTPTGEPT